MTAIQIRDVPDDVAAALSEKARARGQSLQKYLLGVITAEARRGGNRDILARFAGRTDGDVEPSGITAELDVARAGRDSHLGADR